MILITLVSYNIGHGHIVDAQKLALEMGLDSYKWASLEKNLTLVAFQKILQKNKNGYRHGTKPIRYVI